MKKKEKLVQKVKRLLRRAGLPRWLHRYGPKKFEFWHHLLALIFRQECKLSYRRTVGLLESLGLIAPSYSALAKMAKRLPVGLWHRLLESTRSNRIAVAAIDSTTFARSCPSYHYLRRIYRIGPPGVPIKASILVDTRRKKVIAAHVRVLPAHDTRDVEPLLKGCAPRILVADKGYDSEAIHEHCFEKGIVSMIPARKRVRKGFYRRKMLRQFRLRTYHRREIAEALFSAIKRKFGGSTPSRRARTIRAEVFVKCIAHNLSRVLERLFQQSPYIVKPLKLGIHGQTGNSCD